MRPPNEVTFLRRIRERTTSGRNRLFGVDIVVDRDGRVRELDLGGVHNVPPEQKALFPAVQHVGGMTRSVTI